MGINVTPLPFQQYSPSKEYCPCTDYLSGWGFNPTKTTDPNESVKHEYGTIQSNHFRDKFFSHSKLDFSANLSSPDTIISPKPNEHRN